MKSIGTTLAGLLLSLSAAADFCNSLPNALPHLPDDEDRAVFDRTVVAYVKQTVSMPNEANALAQTLLWKRSAAFMEQPRQFERGYCAYTGCIETPRWTDEERGFWEAVIQSSLNLNAKSLDYKGNRVPVTTIADQAFYSGWEVMMARRMFVTHDCR